MTYTPRRQVAYYYDSDVGNFYYAQGHPMKPHRMRMTHNLLVAYELFDKMDVLAAPRASEREMTRFHSDEYISFLKAITPEMLTEQIPSLSRFNVLEDCPVFDGLFEYCQIAAGGSLAGASRLNSGDSSIAINWAGGLHHAKKAEASGFCYINDCVLAILELLKVHPRVLYVDIDIHHGDGVEEAFYTTDRVMTASFHKFGDYFPGTGDVSDVGIGRGKHYSVNFPLRDGINDETYREVFVPVMARVMDWYQPSAVVLQCGADSLSGDRLGCFNLSLFGHSQCVDFFKRYDVPLLLLGGGGYTVRNVARCWAYETSRAVDAPLSDELPYNENYEFYGPDFRLHIAPSNMENHNTPEELQKTKARIFENLRHLPFAPSTQFMETPRQSPLAALRNSREGEENEDADRRYKSHRRKTVVDYAGSDDEDDDQCISSLRRSSKRAKRLNFPSRRKLSSVTGPKSSEKKSYGIPGLGREAYSPRGGGDTRADGVEGSGARTTESGGGWGDRSGITGLGYGGSGHGNGVRDEADAERDGSDTGERKKTEQEEERADGAKKAEEKKKEGGRTSERGGGHGNGLGAVENGVQESEDGMEIDSTAGEDKEDRQGVGQDRMENGRKKEEKAGTKQDGEAGSGMGKGRRETNAEEKGGSGNEMSAQEGGTGREAETVGTGAGVARPGADAEEVAGVEGTGTRGVRNKGEEVKSESSGAEGGRKGADGGVEERKGSTGDGEGMMLYVPPATGSAGQEVRGASGDEGRGDGPRR